jgi:hypothetical protein
VLRYAFSIQLPSLRRVIHNSHERAGAHSVFEESHDAMVRVESGTGIWPLRTVLRGRKVDGVGKDREMRCLIGMADDSAAGAVLDAV